MLFVSMLVMLVVVGGVAWAANLRGDNGANKINGTNRNDTIRGLGGNETLNGRRCADNIYAGRGKDRIVDGQLRTDHAPDYLAGSVGDDILITRNKPASRDFVKCGPGFDKWTADSKDRYYGSRCERVRVLR